ncbi:MAG: helix-turn-helix transcriptional regulator [Chthoniobacter sp.]|nr:helix-turn-helix transcriptional regulator [Chthoniobacter sp.]
MRVPRKNPLPEREQWICRRLATARKILGLSRVAAARKAGIDSTHLRRYEEARTRLRYDDAKKLSRVIGVALPWLAGANTGATEGMDLDDSSFATKLDERALLSEVFEKHLRPLLSAANIKPRKPFIFEVGDKFSLGTKEDVEKLLAEFPTSFRIKGKFIEVLKPMALMMSDVEEKPTRSGK